MKIGMVVAPLIHLLEDVQEAGEVVFVRESGIKHIEVHTNFLDEHIERFMELSEKFGMTYSIHCPHMYSKIPTNFCSADKKWFKNSEEWLKKSIHYAKELGAKNIVVHADVPHKCPRQKALNILEEHIRNNTGLLGKGQRILIENMPGEKFSISTADEMKEFLKRFKGKNTEKVGACWDIGHEAHRFKDFKFRFPKKLGSRIKEVHISGIDKKFCDHHQLTIGVLNLKKCVGELKKINFRGVIIMEIITENPVDVIESKSILERFI